MSPGRPFTLVNECSVDMVGVLCISLWSIPVSCFSLLEDVSCLREWFGLQMGLVRGVKELMSLEQASANEKWELVEKYPRFFPLSRTTLNSAHSSLSKESLWNWAPFVLFINTTFIGFPPFLSHFPNSHSIFWNLLPNKYLALRS